MKQLINPHAHSDGSLDGASTVSDIVKVNKEYGAEYVTLTEHGNLNTAMDLYMACQKHKVKPILGIELYLQPPFLDELRSAYWPFYKDKPGGEKKLEKKLRESYVHLTVHFKDEWAWNYFCRLTPAMEKRAVVKWGESKPICTIDELQGASGHITICSSCLVGAVQKWLIPDRITGEVYPERAERAYHMMRDIAGKDDFFVEIFPHAITHEWQKAIREKDGTLLSAGQFVPQECNSHMLDGDLQKYPNQFVRELAEKNGDRCIISLDSHFAYPQQKVIQDAKLGNGQEAWKFYNSYHVLKTEEAARALKQQMGVDDKTIAQWVENSWEWASRFDSFKLTTSNDRWVMPDLEPDWKRQIKERIDYHGRMDWSDSAMVARLKTEIRLFTQNSKNLNLMPYFFAVEDVARFCQDEGILMNVRGSAGGVLLLYLFNVCAFNPLKHDLSLDRFLTDGRIDSNSLPDVDMDISNKDKVMDYLEKKYGDGFCKISTDMMLKLKSSIKDSERFLLGSVSDMTEKLCKKLPASPQGAHEYEFVFGKDEADGTHIPGVIDYDKDLQKWVQANPKTWAVVTEMLGVQRQKSVHACGVVIAPEPIQNYCPIIYINGNKATGFNPKSVDELGLIKFDFLGVNTLNDIELCLESIKERTGEAIDPWTLPHDDKVMERFHNGDTATVFQFFSPTVIPYLKKIKPTNIEELAQITALCRPGTLDALAEDGRTLADVYVARRQGEPVDYVHPDMEQIIGETMGIALFQEQTLKVFKILAGYSDEKTEVARRGIGKKQKNVLESCMKDLREGCYKRGWVEKQVDLLIEQIMASARYSFNKSHSVSYAYVAYACQWLRTHHPLDWWKSVLSNAPKDEIVTIWWPFIKDIVKEPNINNPVERFSIDGENLVAPLSFLKGVGEKAFHQLVDHAPYKNLTEFCMTHFRKRSKEESRSSVHSGIAQKLIIAGALDSLLEMEDELKTTSNSLAAKLQHFEKVKAKVKGKKKPDAVDPMYFEMSSVGSYLVKKSVLPIHSQDLRPLCLPSHGGYPHETHPNCWVSDHLVLDGLDLRRLRESAENGKGFWTTLQAVGYVVEESVINYANNSKQATKMFVDVNGEFFETILWPPYQEGPSSAKRGFKNKIVLLTYQSKADRFSLQKVEELYSAPTKKKKG